MPSDLTARIIEIADAFVLDLNAQVAVKAYDGTTIAARFTAERTYVRDWKNADLAELKVDVRFPLTVSRPGRTGAA